MRALNSVAMRGVAENAGFRGGLQAADLSCPEEELSVHIAGAEPSDAEIAEWREAWLRERRKRKSKPASRAEGPPVLKLSSRVAEVVNGLHAAEMSQQSGTNSRELFILRDESQAAGLHSRQLELEREAWERCSNQRAAGRARAVRLGWQGARAKASSLNKARHARRAKG